MDRGPEPRGQSGALTTRTLGRIQVANCSLFPIFKIVTYSVQERYIGDGSWSMSLTYLELGHLDEYRLRIVSCSQYNQNRYLFGSGTVHMRWIAVHEPNGQSGVLKLVHLDEDRLRIVPCSQYSEMDV